MKQSQNAITFLRAQYSAIYSRAYIKGLASAMVLSSAVVGTYAQAATATDGAEPSDNTWDRAPTGTLQGVAANPLAQAAASTYASESYSTLSAAEREAYASAARLDSIKRQSEQQQLQNSGYTQHSTDGSVLLHSQPNSANTAFAPSSNSDALAATSSPAPEAFALQGSDALTTSVLDDFAGEVQPLQTEPVQPTANNVTIGGQDYSNEYNVIAPNSNINITDTGLLHANTLNASGDGIALTGTGQIQIGGMATNDQGRPDRDPVTDEVIQDLDASGTANISSNVLKGFVAPESGNGGTVSFTANTNNLNFTDTNTDQPIELSDFTFGQQDTVDQQTPPAADITLVGEAHVQVSGANISIGKDLTSGDALKLDVTATTLNLGNASQDADSNQNGLGVQSLKAQNVNFVGYKDTAGQEHDFVLRDNLDLNAGTGTGASTGNVVIATGADKALNVQTGEYTHTGNFALNSGTVNIGNTNGAVSGNASLVVSGNFTLDNSSGDNTINIVANDANSQARLDLSQAQVTTLLSGGSNYSTTINVGDANGNATTTNAFLQVSNQEQIQQLLGNADGTADNTIKLNSGGQLHVNDDFTIDTSELNSFAGQGQGQNPPIGNTDKGLIFNGGSLGVNTLILTDNKDTNANIGNGIIAANKLLLSGASTEGNTQGDKNFYLESGTIEIDGGTAGTADTPVDVIASADQDQEHKLFIGAGAGAPASANATQGANLNLQGQVDGHYRVATDVTLLGGSTNGAGTTNGPASLAVNNGNWQLQSVTAEGQNNHLNIGANSTETTVTGDALKVAPNSTLKVNGGQASFTNVELNGADSALELNNECLTVTGSGNFTQGSLRGTGDLAVSGQNAQANFTSTSLKNYVTQNDAASVILDQGGALNFADNGPIELTDFAFDNSDTESGDIHVTNASATTPEQNSVITGNDLSLSRELASTDLPVDIHATNLSLGSDRFDSQKAAHGLGVDTLQAQNVSFNAGPSDAFMLKDQLNLRAPNQADGSTGSGSVSGNVIVAGGADNGFNVQLGNYTTTDKITLAQGELNVGNDTNTSGNASLALSGSGSELHLDNTAGNNTINVTANGDGYSANLDLTGTTISAVKDSSNTYYTSLNVGTAASTPAPAPAPAQTSASVDLKSSDLQALLNNNNIAVNLATNSELHAQSGDLVLESTDLVNGTATAAGQIAFNQGGHRNVAGDVTLQYDGSSTSNVINLGQGSISSHSLALHNTAASTSRNAARANTNPTLTIGTGTYNINATQDSGALITGVGQTVGIGDGTTSGSAVLNINGRPTGTEYTIETDLALTSNSNTGNSATVNLNNGNFSANNIYANGDSNSLNIGTPSDPQANPTAALSGKDLELGTDSTLNVSGGEATFTNVALGSGSTLALNNERLTVANGSGDFSQGKLQGTGHLAVVGADANASLQGQNFSDFVSGGAQVTLQEGADLNLSGDTNTDLTQFTYDDGTGSGDVHVIASNDPTVDNSKITGKNLTISKELTSGDDLALDVKADNLTLGSNNYDSASDTNGLGVGSLQAQNVAFVGNTTAAGDTSDFTLRDQLNLRAPATSTGTATGTISGNVVLAGGVDNGLHVQEGNYTQSGNLSLASGDLTVGNTTGLSGDASLAVSGNFALNNQAGNNSITVNHNELGGTSGLDLTDATLTVNGDSTGANFTTFNVGTSPIALAPNPNAATAQLDVTAEQLQTLLEGDAAGVLLGQNGEVNAQHGNGSGDLSLDTADLLSGTQAAAGKVVFNNGGVLRVDQLTLNGTSKVNIGDGTLDTNTLAVNNTTQGATDAVLEDGNYEVADALSSTNSNIVLEQGANLTLGDFELDPNNVDHPDTAVVSGSLAANPGTISSNLVLNSGSKLNVQQGDWTLNGGSGDLSATNANIVIGAVNASGEAYQVYDDQGSGSVVSAALNGNNLNLTESTLDVNVSGKADFNGIDTSSGSGSTLNIKGDVSIANSVKLNSGDHINIVGTNGWMRFEDQAAHNLTANTDGSTLNVNAGTFDNVFYLQSGGHLELELGDQTFSLAQIQELRKTLLADADASGSVMDPGQHGYIHLGGAKVTGVGSGDGSMIPVAFDKYIPTTGEFTPGTMPPIASGDTGTGTGTGGTGGTSGQGGTAGQILALSADNRDAMDLLADIKDIRTDLLDDILLYDINTETEGDVVTGNVGALMVNDSGATSPKFAEIGDATLAHAYAVSGSNGHRQFISDQETGALLGANVQSGGVFNLQNGGYIGNITLEDGTSAEGSNPADLTTLVVQERNPDKAYASGDEGITYIASISGGANTAFINNDVTHINSGSVTVGNLQNTSELTIDSGDLTVSGGDTVLASGSKLTVNGNTTLDGNNIAIDGTNTFNGSLNASGDTALSISGANTVSGDTTLAGGAINVDGTNQFNGKLDATGSNVSVRGTNNVSGNASFIANSGSVYIYGEQNISGSATLGASGIVDSDITKTSTTWLGANSKLNVAGDLITTGTVRQATSSTITANNLNMSSGDIINLAGNNTFTGSGSISAADATNGTVTLGGNQSFALGVEVTGNTITLAGGNITASSGDINFSGSNVNLQGGTLQGTNINVSGDTITLAGGNISASSGDINFNGSNVNLQGGTLQGTNINVSGDTIAVDGTNNFSGSTTLSSTQDIKLNSGSVVNASGDLFFNGNVIQDSGNTINAQNVSFDNTAVQGGQGGQGGQGSTPTEPVTSILAGNNNFEQASFAGNYELLGSNNIDTLDLGTANGGKGYVLQVGTDTGSTAQASLEVNTLHLNGNTLYADPAYGEATTLVAIKNDTGAGAGGTGGTGGTGTVSTPVLDGDLILGKNVAAAWGMDKAALQQEIAAYQTNGSLNYDTTGQGTGVGTILVVNQPMHVADGSHIVLNSDPNTTGATDTAAINQLSDGRVADLALSDQSQLMINLGAVGQSEAQNTPAITFDKTGAVITAESGAKIVLSGEIYDIRNEIDIFADADTESGSTGVELVGSDIQVSTANGLFTTTLLAKENGATQDNVGHVKLKTTEQQIKSHFYRASDPVVDTLVAYKDSNPNADGRSAYLNSALQVAGEDGTAAETAARMAVYGGAVNTALAVNNTTSDAIARRTGIGHGAPGGTFFKSSSPLELWASPVYSRVESDGLAAEGVDYGTEIDLTGLNAGVELKLNADTKLGAMVNWGQGSADGTGIASGVSNDFDYYGLGAYAATKIQNFNLVGDVSYSKVSNDISSNNKVDSINTSVDTTNLSLGLTGRLDLDVNGIQVSPHAGVRYQRIEMDDYSVNSRHHGRVVDYKSDQINLLSMPVGVMITNDYITRSGWQLKPAIDFTATFNIGDNDANGVAVWTGSNLSTPLSTEIIDPFTFGVNVGFSVRKGNFSAGTGINYTSSENTSDFGIQANLRYDF